MKKVEVALTLLLAVVLVITGLRVASLVNAMPSYFPTYPKTIIVPIDYSTIQGAVNAAIDGDTVFVRKGIYRETITIQKSISMIGEDRNSTIIDAQEAKRQVILIQGNNIIVANFTLGNNRYGPSTGKYWVPENGEGDGINIVPVSNYITIANNTIFDCSLDGVNAHFSQHNSIVGNTIMKSHYGVLVTCVESVIANNIFVNVTVGVEFTTSEVRVAGVNGREQSWILNKSNVIQGNQNITQANISSPFSSFVQEPEPNETELYQAMVAIAAIISVIVVVGLVVYLKRKQ